MRRLQARPGTHNKAPGAPCHSPDVTVEAAAGCSEHASAQRALSESPLSALRNLEVHEADGTLVLTGSVPSYYYKQLAQETVRPLVGRLGLVNQICVVKLAEAGGTGTGELSAPHADELAGG